MAQRKKIKLAPEEVDLLRGIYLAKNIPLCQFKQRNRDARKFLEEWNNRSGRTDEWGDIIHYMVTCRKSKKSGGWPALGDGHQRLADPEPSSLTKQEWEVLEAIYEELLLSKNSGSDNLLYDPSIRSELARLFATRAGRTLSSAELVGVIFASRKRGELVGLKRSKEEDLGWSDIKDVG